MGTGDLLGKPNKLLGSDRDGLASRPGGVEILLATSCYGNRDKLWHDEPVGSIRLQIVMTYTTRVQSTWAEGCVTIHSFHQPVIPRPCRSKR